MGNSTPNTVILQRWLSKHPGIFSFQEASQEFTLLELHSGKVLSVHISQLNRVEERQNTLNPNENYLILLFESGHQLVLSAQGFAFAPVFTNSGPLPLPNQVYCLQDFQNLFDKLRHLAGEESRNPEAFQLILVLIAILDGAKAIGLEVGAEEKAVDQILTRLETGA